MTECRLVMRWQLRNTPAGWISIEIYLGAHGLNLPSVGHLLVGADEYRQLRSLLEEVAEVYADHFDFGVDDDIKLDGGTH